MQVSPVFLPCIGSKRHYSFQNSSCNHQKQFSCLFRSSQEEKYGIFSHFLELLSLQNFKDGAHIKCLPLCWEHEKASSSHVTSFTRLNLAWRIAFALQELKAIFAWAECWSSSDDKTLKSLLFLVLCYSTNMQTMHWQCSHFLCLHQSWSTFVCLNMNPNQEIKTLCSLMLHSCYLLNMKGRHFLSLLKATKKSYFE